MSDLTRTYELELPLTISYEATSDQAANKLAARMADSARRGVDQTLAERPYIQTGVWVLREGQDKQRLVRHAQYEQGLRGFLSLLRLPLGVGVLGFAVTDHITILWVVSVMWTIRAAIDEIVDRTGLQLASLRRGSDD